MANVKNPYSEARRKANQKWDSENIYRVTCTFPKKLEQNIKDVANNNGCSVPALIRSIVTDFIERDK